GQHHNGGGSAGSSRRSSQDSSYSRASHATNVTSMTNMNVSKAMTFTAGNYAARKAFDFASCGTSQIDLMDRTSTVGLKFTYVPGQKYKALACAGSGEPSC
ncbi:MAG: hypothetical protein PHE43_03270, partial [Candidatus Nanoarchaeia archaeon]|nr:hypothetical protein [Candidatus Nanoarchaeia archaeon]